MCKVFYMKNYEHLRGKSNWRDIIVRYKEKQKLIREGHNKRVLAEEGIRSR
jgi:hypothetical protein